MLVEELGLEGHPSKGVWRKGTMRLEHLGVVWYTNAMEFSATLGKVEKIKRMASVIMREVRAGLR